MLSGYYETRQVNVVLQNPHTNLTLDDLTGSIQGQESENSMWRLIGYLI